MNTAEKLKIVKETVLSASPNWSIRSEETDILYFLYKEDAQKANCGTACILGILFLPFSIIYAILGGKKGVSGAVNVKIVEDKIQITGDLSFALKVFKILRKDQLLTTYVEENDVIKKAKRAEINTIIGGVFVLGVMIWLFVSILSRGY